MKNMKDFNYDDVILLEELGKGGFSTVRKAYHKRKCKYIAMKKLKIIKNNDKNHVILNEHNILRALQSFSDRNPEYSHLFLSYDGVFKDSANNEVSYILQMENGICTLANILSAGKKYTPDEMLSVLKILVDGFAFLQDMGIANRDIKPLNIILVENKGKFLYKISDFGIGCIIRKKVNEISSGSLSGHTKTFAAPEIFDFKSKMEKNIDLNKCLYDPFKADVFSLGVLAIKMINYTIKRKDIDTGIIETDDIPELKGNIAISHLLKIMLEKNPKNRPNFIQLKEKIAEITKKPSYNNSTEIKDEFKYYELFVNKQEEEQRKTLDATIELYRKHFKLHEAYSYDVSGNKMAKYHLDKCYEILNDKKFLNRLANSADLFNYEEEMVACLISYADHFSLKGDLKICKSYLKECLQYINTFPEYYEYKVDEIFIKIKENHENIHDFVNESLLDGAKKESILKTIANVCRKYGILFEDLGNFRTAEEFYQKALIIQKENFGENSSDTAQTYNNLGSLYCNLGNLGKSEYFYKKALEIRKNIYGEKHPSIADSFNNLGVLCLNKGNLNEAIKFFNKAFDIRIEIFGKKHGDIADSYGNFGSYYESYGNLEDAKEYQEKALKLRLALFGENHAASAKSYRNLGVLHYKMNDFAKAEEFFNKSLEIRKKIFGDNHSSTADSYDKLGVLYEKKGMFLKAEQYKKKALQIRDEFYGGKHSSIADSYINLGLLCFKKSNYLEAEEFYKKALELREELYGEEHCDSAQSYHNLGGLYYKMNKLQQAEEFKKKALEIRLKILGEKNSDTAHSYKDLGDLYEKLGNLEKAKEFQKNALKIRRSILGDNSSETAESFYKYALLLGKMGENTEAKNLLSKTYDIYKSIYGANHQFTKSVLDNLNYYKNK